MAQSIINEDTTLENLRYAKMLINYLKRHHVLNLNRLPSRDLKQAVNHLNNSNNGIAVKTLIDTLTNDKYHFYINPDTNEAVLGYRDFQNISARNIIDRIGLPSKIKDDKNQRNQFYDLTIIAICCLFSLIVLENPNTGYLDTNYANINEWDKSIQNKLTDLTNNNDEYFVSLKNLYDSMNNLAIKNSSRNRLYFLLHGIADNLLSKNGYVAIRENNTIFAKNFLLNELFQMMSVSDIRLNDFVNNVIDTH